MGLFAKLLAALGGFVAAVMDSITDAFLTPPLRATLEHLEETDLKTLSGGESRRCARSRRTGSVCAALVTRLIPTRAETKTFKARSLWENSGAVVMAVRRPG